MSEQCGALSPEGQQSCRRTGVHAKHLAGYPPEDEEWLNESVDVEALAMGSPGGGRKIPQRELLDDVRKVREHQRARARLTDPVTSHEAAASLGDLRQHQWEVYLALREHGPMIDEDLVPLVPTQTPSGVRTRRREVANLGLAEFTGEYGVTSTGARSMIWRVKEPRS